MGQVWQGFPRGEKFSPHVTLLKILNPFNISGMDEATLLKFCKWSTTAGVKNFSW